MKWDHAPCQQPTLAHSLRVNGELARVAARARSATHFTVPQRYREPCIGAITRLRMDRWRVREAANFSEVRNLRRINLATDTVTRDAGPAAERRLGQPRAGASASFPEATFPTAAMQDRSSPQRPQWQGR